MYCLYSNSIYETKAPTTCIRNKYKIFATILSTILFKLTFNPSCAPTCVPTVNSPRGGTDNTVYLES